MLVRRSIRIQSGVFGRLAGIGLLALMALAQVLPAMAETTAVLRPVSAFDGITDERDRALALFNEAGKVLQHPRCVNCHPATDRPLQGDAMRPHIPAVQRGDGGLGVAGLRCTTCHQAANYDAVGIPGHPEWHLAPAEMAWADRSLGQICSQIKDPARNGGKDMAALIEHMAEDSLVGWGWQPGAGRSPAPGTQAVFGELIAAWSASGAHCPAE